MGGLKPDDPGDSGWGEDRRKVDHSRKKKKKKDGRDAEGYDVRPTERRPKRESGKTWRDYAGDSDDWDF